MADLAAPAPGTPGTITFNGHTAPSMAWGRWAVADHRVLCPRRDTWKDPSPSEREPHFGVYLLNPDGSFAGTAWGSRTRWAAECFARASSELFPNPDIKADRERLLAFRKEFKAPPEPYSPERLKELQEDMWRARGRCDDADQALKDAEKEAEDADDTRNEWELLLESMKSQQKQHERAEASSPARLAPLADALRQRREES